jgi:hypothetical protein
LAKSLEPSIGFGLTEFPLLREKYMNYYNTTNIKPEVYGFMNRNKGQRYIKNYQEVIDALNNITNYVWKMLYNNLTDREGTAKTFASLKILVCAGGSFIWNAFQMHPFTGLYILGGSYIDYCISVITYHLSVWMIFQSHPKIIQFGGDGGDADITKIKENIFILINAVKNGKWGNNNLTPGFNITKIKMVVDENIESQKLLSLFNF